MQHLLAAEDRVEDEGVRSEKEEEDHEKANDVIEHHTNLNGRAKFGVQPAATRAPHSP